MQQITDEAYDAYLKERGLTRSQYTTNELLAVAAAREVPAHRDQLGGLVPSQCGSMVRPSDGSAGRFDRGGQSGFRDTPT